MGKERCKKTEVLLNVDSELIGNQIDGTYKVLDKKLFPYFIKVNNLKIDFAKIKINIINREKNLADKLVKETLSTSSSQLFKI